MLNFEAAQHIDKQITALSYMINPVKDCIELGGIISGCGLPSCSGAFWLVIVPDRMCSIVSIVISDYSSTQDSGGKWINLGGRHQRVACEEGCSFPRWEERSRRGQYPLPRKIFNFGCKNGNFCCILGFWAQFMHSSCLFCMLKWVLIQYISQELCFWNVTNHTKEYLGFVTNTLR